MEIYSLLKDKFGFMGLLEDATLVGFPSLRTEKIEYVVGPNRGNNFNKWRVGHLDPVPFYTPFERERTR